MPSESVEHEILQLLSSLNGYVDQHISLRGWYDIERIDPIAVVIYGTVVFGALRIFRSRKLGVRL